MILRSENTLLNHDKKLESLDFTQENTPVLA